MIGLSLDGKIETAKKYVAENELKWLQGFQSDWSKSTIAKEYGIEGIPAKFLIGADGKIIAKNLRGEQLKLAVTKAIEKEPGKKTNVNDEIQKR
jgi:hypothetical protein